MKGLIPWVIIVFRLWLLLCSILYVYWLINGKWTETEFKSPNKFRIFLGTGAFITLFLIIYHGIRTTFPFLQTAAYHWWEGDIWIPIYLPLALIVTVWIERTLHAQYFKSHRKNKNSKADNMES